MGVRISDREFEMLAGANHIEFRLYCMIRRRMDYGTGTVGVVRAVSWATLAEDVFGVYGERIQVLHRAARGLIKAGLLERITSDRRLAFRCLAADTDRGAIDQGDRPMRYAPGAVADRPSCTESVAASTVCDDSTESGDRPNSPGAIGPSDRGAIDQADSFSGYPVYKNYTTARAREEAVEPARPWAAMLTPLSRTFGAGRLQTPKLVQAAMRWRQAGGTPADVGTALELVTARKGDGNFAPEYLIPVIDQLIADRSRPSAPSARSAPRPLGARRAMPYTGFSRQDYDADTTPEDELHPLLRED